jgi:hypothetical protein
MQLQTLALIAHSEEIAPQKTMLNLPVSVELQDFGKVEQTVQSFPIVEQRTLDGQHTLQRRDVAPWIQPQTCPSV